MNCANCGAIATADAKFCPNCGKPLSTVAEQSSRLNTSDQQTQGGHVGDLDPYYRERFARFDGNGGRFGAAWNWPAFVFSIIWYFTKGMWAKGALLLGITLVATISTPGLGILLHPINLVVGVYAGLAGNYDYYLWKRKHTQWWS